jgi:hypothetical protein
MTTKKITIEEYAEEIHGDSESFCNYCDNCEANCAGDI